MISLESIKRWLLGYHEELEVEDLVKDSKFKRKNVVDECLDYWKKRRAGK